MIRDTLYQYNNAYIGQEKMVYVQGHKDIAKA